MPEGPEVRIITEQMNKEIQWKHIKDIKILGGRFLKSPPENLNKCLQSSTGTAISYVGCKGKFIYFDFNNGWYLWNTLGMTGHWGLEKDKHSSLEIEFKDGPSVFFTDPRRFGTIKFVYDHKTLQEKLWKLGHDILEVQLPPRDGMGLSEDQIARIARRTEQKVLSSDKTLAEILMDQSLFAGVGNYIKSEALFHAHLSPWRKGNSLDEKTYRELLASIHHVMGESYKAGGATLATYKHFDGSVGKYSDQLRVYGQKEWDGKPIQKETTADGRTSFWVPGRQV